ncbi:hypothetical protein Hypma_002564 [Hypsizygus marmoreus]|uniref:Uncharacterized protein n=1 Tax=Hypsizygus marmoreus TaxID=39966 RepID=A0A369J932_HYPMA|nr:hypothetical protein Hypma_002564 [Hypsizygus marmoreus]
MSFSGHVNTTVKPLNGKVAPPPTDSLEEDFALWFDLRAATRPGNTDSSNSDARSGTQTQMSTCATTTTNDITACADDPTINVPFLSYERYMILYMEASRNIFGPPERIQLSVAEHRRQAIDRVSKWLDQSPSPFFDSEAPAPDADTPTVKRN